MSQKIRVALRRAKRKTLEKGREAQESKGIWKLKGEDFVSARFEPKRKVSCLLNLTKRNNMGEVNEKRAKEES